MQQHPHVQMIMKIIRDFREGKTRFSRLQLELASIASALEGDMPNANAVRQILRSSENEIEIAWYTMDERSALVEIENILNKLETFVMQTDN